jgi:magnesium chelatase subunit D
MKDTGSGGGGPGASWADAGLAAALVAVDPAGLGGVALRARHGPVRAAWLEGLTGLLPEGMPLRRVPPQIGDERLLGGLDLAATLSAGRPVASRGLLAEADGGLAVLPMAERAEAGLVARLAAALDTGAVRTERDGLSREHAARIGVVALDEAAEADEGADPALLDRLAFHLDLTAMPAREATPLPWTARDVAAARAALPEIEAGEDLGPALTASAAQLGIGSLRAPLFALRATRALLALLGDRLTEQAAAEIAARLVLAPRATQLPAEAADDEDETPPEPEEPETPEDREEDETPELPDGELAERVLEAVQAVLPPGLLAEPPGARARGGGPLGRAGALRRAPDRGRPIGSRPGRPAAGARLDLVSTLRAAAPWQRLRAAESGRVAVRAEDFRIRRFKRKSATATIFVVDASGSTAVARLAEAKGAVELLLAEAYVRRDQVALVAFRGAGAEILLPPTNAPALAKRRLAGLPGGGGTPLAAGIEAGMALAERLAARGTTPHLLVLTDGRANVGRDGQPGRPKAAEDAEAAATAARAAGLSALVIDTGLRPRPEAEALARALGGRYLPMPRADAAGLTAAAKAVRPGG